MITNNFIYLLQERKFINSKQNIFKIGRTCQNATGRFNQYPKNSILLFHINCSNCIKYETILKNKFESVFKLRKDIGLEYFEGDYKHMINIIYNTNNDIATETNNNAIVKIDKIHDSNKFFIIYKKNTINSNIYIDDVYTDYSINNTLTSYYFKSLHFFELSF